MIWMNEDIFGFSCQFSDSLKNPSAMWPSAVKQIKSKSNGTLVVNAGITIYKFGHLISYGIIIWPIKDNSDHVVCIINC